MIPVRNKDIINANVGSNELVDSNPEKVEESLALIEDLKFFLATAPANWQENQVIRRYYLNNDEGFVSCVFWNNLYYITGTDIVRCCIYRMQKFGRQVIERKKFEEGIFSDLRNLKCGVDATLEMPKSEFLAFLYKNMCLKTQKKQKVFFWFSVPHDKLFADALERDLKREITGQSSTTTPISEPALSFCYSEKSGMSLYDQVLHHLDSQKTNISQISTTELPVNLNNSSPTLRRSDNDLFEQTGGIPQDESCKDISTECDPQKLIIENSDNDPVDETEYSINLDAQPSEILKGDVDEFPFEYFPVEIEYPQHDQNKILNTSCYDNEVEMLPMTLPLSASIYENPYIYEDLPNIPMSTLNNKYIHHSSYVPTNKGDSIPNSEFDVIDIKKQSKENEHKFSPPRLDSPQNLDTCDDFAEMSIPNSNTDFRQMNILQDNYMHLYGNAYPNMYLNGYPGVYPNGYTNSYTNGYINGYPSGYHLPMVSNGDMSFLADSYFSQYQMDDHNHEASMSHAQDLYLPHTMHSHHAGMSFPHNYRKPSASMYMNISPYTPKPPGPSINKNVPFNICLHPSSYYHRMGIHNQLRGFPSIQATSVPQPTSANRFFFNMSNRTNTPEKVMKPKIANKKSPAYKLSTMSTPVQHEHLEKKSETDAIQISETADLIESEHAQSTTHDDNNK